MAGFPDPTTLLHSGVLGCVLLCLAVAVDGIVPVVPAEVGVLAAGTALARDAVNPVLVVAAIVAGGILGDAAGYGVGRLGWGRARSRGRRRPPRARGGMAGRLAAGLERHTMATMIAARFVPGGRTVVAVANGARHCRFRRFVAASSIGVTLWTAYTLGIGYLSGRVSSNLVVSVAVGLATSALVGGLGAVIGSRRRSRHADAAVAQLARPSAPGAADRAAAGEFAAAA